MSTSNRLPVAKPEPLQTLRSVSIARPQFELSVMASRVLNPTTPHDHRLNIQWAFRLLYACPVLAVVGLVLGKLTHDPTLLGALLVLSVLTAGGAFGLRFLGVRAYTGTVGTASRLTLAGALLALVMAVLESLLFFPATRLSGGPKVVAQILLLVVFVVFLVILYASFRGTRSDSGQSIEPPP